MEWQKPQVSEARTGSSSGCRISSRRTAASGPGAPMPAAWRATTWRWPGPWQASQEIPELRGLRVHLHTDGIHAGLDRGRMAAAAHHVPDLALVS